MKAVIWLGAIALAATVACGNTGEPSATAGANEKVGLDELAPTMADAICDFFERCGHGPEEGEGLDPDYCRPELTKILEDGNFAEARMQIESGRVRFDSVRARECLDGLGDTCDQRDLEDCYELPFEGTVPSGGDCDDSDQCAGEAACLPEASCPGTCTELVGAGQPCDSDLMLCAGGLSCSGARICEEPEEPEVAPPLGPGDPCFDEGCVAGSYCVDGTCQSYASLFAADEGATCDPGKGSTYCRAGLSCAVFAVEPAQMWTCVGPSSLGGACRFGLPDPCPPDDYCSDTSPQTGDFEGTCAPLPRDGQPCALGGQELLCASGHICIEAGKSGTCRARQRIGDPCTVEDECYSLFCDAGRCAVQTHGPCADESAM